MLFRNNLLRLPAILAIGLFTFANTGLAEETASPEAGANEAIDEAERDKKSPSRKRKDPASSKRSSTDE